MSAKPRTNPLFLPLTGKNLAITIAVLVTLGGAWGIWSYLDRHPSPWMVRWQVMRYLKKNSLSSDFKVAFPFTSKAEMAKAPPKPKNAEPAVAKGKLTGKEFEALAREYIELKTALLRLERDIPEAELALPPLKLQIQTLTKDVAEAKAANSTNLTALRSQLRLLERRQQGLEKILAGRPDLEAKQTALAPLLSDLWDFQRVWAAEFQAADPGDPSTLAGAHAKLTADGRERIANAQSYGVIYKVIGQQLWVAARLLASANPDHRRVGVGLAMDASRTALEEAQNGWLVASIIRGYVWPHLDVAEDRSRRSPFNLENLLGQCVELLRRSDNVDGVIQSYQLLLARAPSPQRADQARAEIAQVCEQAGQFQEAIDYLRQIKATNDFRWAIGRIPRLERSLKAAP